METPDRPWSTSAAAAAVRDLLSGPGAIARNALLLDAVPAPGGVLLTFTWRKDPTVYGYLADDSRQRSRGASSEEWARDLWWRLKEQLETGGVRWAARRTRSEPVILDLDRPPTERERYYVGRVMTEPFPPGTHVIVRGGGPVPEFDPALAGRWLEAAGLHVERARRSLLAGTLLCWLQTYTNEERPTLVGHAAASWAEDGSAVLDALEVVPGIEGGEALLARLLWSVVYEATEQGADRVDLSAAPRQVVHHAGVPLGAGSTALTLPPPPDVDPRHR